MEKVMEFEELKGSEYLPCFKISSLSLKIEQE